MIDWRKSSVELIFWEKHYYKSLALVALVTFQGRTVNSGHYVADVDIGTSGWDHLFNLSFSDGFFNLFLNTLGCYDKIVMNSLRPPPPPFSEAASLDFVLLLLFLTRLCLPKAWPTDLIQGFVINCPFLPHRPVSLSRLPPMVALQ